MGHRQRNESGKEETAILSVVAVLPLLAGKLLPIFQIKCVHSVKESYSRLLRSVSAQFTDCVFAALVLRACFSLALLWETF